jgi:outer membrane protein assembly factor BamB
VADSRLVGDVVLTELGNGKLDGFDAASGDLLWRWPADGSRSTGTQIIAVEPDAVHLFTKDNALVTLDLRTGRERSHYILTQKHIWDVGATYAVRGYVFIERIQPGAKPSAADSRYFYAAPSVQFWGT